MRKLLRRLFKRKIEEKHNRFLMIEHDKNLCAAYGLAVAWINSTEYSLELLLRFKFQQKEVPTSFGPKIGLLRKVTKGLPKELFQDILGKLNELNETRVTLDHAVTGETRDMNKVTKPTGKYTLSTHTKEKPFSLKTLQETVLFAKEISFDLGQALLKKSY